MSVSGQKENDVESQSEIDENSALVKKKHPLNQKLPYPKRVIFLICNAFCERFNYYGIRGKYIKFSRLVRTGFLKNQSYFGSILNVISLIL